MSDAIESQGTYLTMNTGTGEAKTITAIALGNPTILTCSSHGLSNGDVVAAASFAGDDAADINGNTYVVKNVTTNTFAIELDSTSLTITDNTDTATMTPQSYTEIGEIVDQKRADGGSKEIDVTHLRSTAKEFLVGLKDWGTYTFDLNWLFNDVGQAALLTAQTNNTLKTFVVHYSNTSTATFEAYVMNVSGPDAASDDKLVGSVTLKITGAVTFA